MCIFCYKKNVDINNKILNYVPFFFFVVSFPVNLVTLPFCNIALSILFSLLFFFNFLILRITFILFVYIYNFIIIVYHSNKIFFCLPKNIVDFFVTIFLIYLGLRFYFDISILTSFCSPDDVVNNIDKKNNTLSNNNTSTDTSFMSKIKEVDSKYPYLKYFLFFGVITIIVYCGTNSFAVDYYFSKPIFNVPPADINTLRLFFKLMHEFENSTYLPLSRKIGPLRYMECNLRSRLLTTLGLNLLAIYSKETENRPELRDSIL